MDQAILAIIGLGNPGPDYHATRHNAGASLVQLLANQFSSPLKSEKKLNGSHCRINWASHDIHLLVPGTYMNESGRSVQSFLNFYKFKPTQVLIAHDDIDLPVGDVRLKIDGGHGGNNGLRSIINTLGTKQFPRLRLGVGHPGEKHKVSRHVLQKPNSGEQQQIDQAIDRAILILPLLFQGDWSSAMNQLHRA